MWLALTVRYILILRYVRWPTFWCFLSDLNLQRTRPRLCDWKSVWKCHKNRCHGYTHTPLYTTCCFVVSRSILYFKGTALIVSHGVPLLFRCSKVSTPLCFQVKYHDLTRVKLGKSGQREIVLTYYRLSLPSTKVSFDDSIYFLTVSCLLGDHVFDNSDSFRWDDIIVMQKLFVVL